MYVYLRGRAAWLALLGAALIVLVASSPAFATGSTLRAAPLSSEFRAYQAALEVRRAMSWNGALGHALGELPAPLDPSLLHGVRDVSRLAREALPSSYPSSYDLRVIGKLTPVRDQGRYGACWAFGAYASMESALLPGETRDFSEDNMVLTSGFDSEDDPYDSGGSTSMSTAYLVRWGGPVDESEDAYGDAYTPPGLSANKHVQDVLYIPGGSSGADTAAIKSALMTYGAVRTGVHWESSSYLPAQHSFYDDGSQGTNHAVVIVGWDDAFAASRFASTPAGNGAWLMRNSWGPAWGDAGYFWVSYYDAHCGRDNVFNAVFSGAEPTTNYDSIYSHDRLGWIDSIGYTTNSETAWMANVFTATSSQAITAAGVYAPVPGTTYTVYAGGVDVNGAPGTLLAKGSGTISTPGYRTIKFSSARWATPGSKFAVAIRLTTPGFDWPIAYEYAEDDYSSAARASPKQSFTRSTEGGPWADFTGYDPTANVCLKAYAANDTEAPSTTAAAASVKKGGTVTLKSRVSDPLPSCGTATVKIQILKAGKIVKTINVGSRSTNAASTYRWKATLAKGSYTWRAWAKDLAGRASTTMTAAKLVIK
jgi:C1A family cysteine protease